MNTESIAQAILSKATEDKRHLVCVAGPPGAGKSTLADALCQEIIKGGESCMLVPMDGFHLDNGILINEGLLDRKGSPPTFDAEGFVHLVQRLATGDSTVYIPVFDRERDIAIAGAEAVEPDCKILVIEGNYLLLDTDPWTQLMPYWQSSVFIDPGIDVIRERLKQRWLYYGLSENDAIKRVAVNDLPNAETVLSQSRRASVDWVIRQDADER